MTTYVKKYRNGLKSPTNRNRMKPTSPIASVKRSKANTNKSPGGKQQKSSLVQNLLRKMGNLSQGSPKTADNNHNGIVSTHDLNKELDNENNLNLSALDSSTLTTDSLQDRSELFSQKYVDTISERFDENEDGMMSPAVSPKKGKQVLDKECEQCVQHMRRCVWNSAYDESSMDGFLFMKYAPQLPKNYFDDKKPVLPPKTSPHSHTLVLDLDETLVHCQIETTTVCDVIFPVVFNGEHYKVYMKKRPFFEEFLRCVSQMFEVVIFTASQKCYANKLLNIVDPQKKYISHRLFRDHCINVEGNYVKDLRVLGRDLSKTIIIDNSPPAFTFQIENGIPIVSWFDCKKDKELEIVIPLLRKLATLHDVRPALKKYFLLNKLLKSIRV